MKAGKKEIAIKFDKFLKENGIDEGILFANLSNKKSLLIVIENPACFNSPIESMVEIIVRGCVNADNDLILN